MLGGAEPKSFAGEVVAIVKAARFVGAGVPDRASLSICPLLFVLPVC